MAAIHNANCTIMLLGRRWNPGFTHVCSLYMFPSYQAQYNHECNNSASVMVMTHPFGELRPDP